MPDTSSTPPPDLANVPWEPHRHVHIDGGFSTLSLASSLLPPVGAEDKKGETQGMGESRRKGQGLGGPFISSET